MRQSLSILALGLAFTLSACGGPVPTTAPAPSASSVAPVVPSTTSEAPSEPVEGGEVEVLVKGDYAFAIGNTFGKFTFPGEPDPEMNKLMSKLGDTKDMTFVSVTVDNRDGFEDAFIHEIRVYDAAGKEYVFERAVDFVDVLQEELPEGVMSYEKYMELFDEHTDSASRGEVRDFLMISGDPIPDEFARITIDTGASMGEVDAVTLAEGEAQGMPLDF